MADTFSDAKKRQKLWEALNDYVSTAGGWIVSMPGARILRIEIPQRSPLAAKLSELGYRVLHVGVGTRLTPGGTVETITAHSTQPTPIIRQHPGWLPVDILEIELAKG